MARGRKSGPSRLDLRRESEAAEAREREEADESGGDEEELEEEADEDAEADGEVEASDDDAGDDDEESPKPKKKAKAKVAKVKAPAKPRKTRVKEAPRMKAVWIVYDNSGKPQGEFAFKDKAEAEALLARKIEEKKQTFYLQMVKQPIEA